MKNATETQFETVIESVNSWDFDNTPVLIGLYEGFEMKKVKPRGDQPEKETKFHKLILENSTPCGVWDCYAISKGLKEENIGKLHRITFLGKVELDNGGTMNNYKIEVAKAV